MYTAGGQYARVMVWLCAEPYNSAAGWYTHAKTMHSCKYIGSSYHLQCSSCQELAMPVITSSISKTSHTQTYDTERKDRMVQQYGFMQPDVQFMLV